MEKIKLKNLSFEELRNNFLDEKYNDFCQHNAAMNELHDKLPSVEDLIPLLVSDIRDCQYTASYIAALEGEAASPIFPYLLKLLDSPWEDVRDEVCDCFLSCTSDAKHYALLFNHLDDIAKSIRLHIITIIFGLKKDVLESIYSYLKKNSNDDSLIQGLLILCKQLSNEEREGFITKGTRKEKIFSYIATYINYGNGSKLREDVQLSKENDIVSHFEIYFCDK